MTIDRGSKIGYNTIMYGSNISALVVDDERINTLIFEKLLSGFGIETVSAAEGKECLKVCGQRSFDYVFLDIRMPGMNGFDTIRQLRHLFEMRNTDIPIICITAMTGKDEREEILDAGFTDIMTKPINKDALREMLFRYAPEGKEIIEENSEDDEGEENLPDSVKNIRGLDAEYGVSHCGSVSDFLSALKIFSNSIDEKADFMEECLKRGYIEDLEMAVHSLKSTSVAVGAKQISEMAKLLEKACGDHNIPLVYSLVPEFLDKYRDMGEELKEVWNGEDGETELKIISGKELQDAFDTLKELIAAYDRKNADNLLYSLKNYNLPPDWKSFFDRLKEHLRKMDWESARKLMDVFGAKQQ